MIIYKNFAKNISKANEEIVSDLMTATPLGRAYKKDDAPYVDDVHLFSTTGEDMEIHLSNEWKFHLNPKRFGGKIYMGAAGSLNLGFIAAAKPAAAILFDVNAAQTFFWNSCIKALAECDTPRNFISFLKEENKSLSTKLAEKFAKAGGNSNPDRVAKGFRDAGGLDEWVAQGIKRLHADRFWMHFGYSHLHLMAKQGAIGAITLDVTDKKACLHLKRYLKEMHKDTKIDMLYISNIFNFLGGNRDWSGRKLKDATPEKAKKNLQLLLADGAMIIHARPTEKLTWPARGSTSAPPLYR